MPSVDPSVNYGLRSIHFLLNPVPLDKDTTPEDFLHRVLQGLVSRLFLPLCILHPLPFSC